MYRREIDVYASHSLDTRARRPARAPRARGVARTRSKNTHEKDKKTKFITFSSRARLFIIYKKIVCNSSLLIQSLNANIRDSGAHMRGALFSHDKRHDTQVVQDRSMRATG